jgi:NodT family efflux transporter outer membrane factor (OMF) lipoprotein
MPINLFSTAQVPWRCKASLAGWTLALAGCANVGGIGPQTHMTEAQTLGLQSTAANTPAATGVAAQGGAWWSRFGDAQLDALVQKALDKQPSLRLAQARVARAQALAGVVGSADLPNVTASAEAMRQRITANGIYPPPLAGTALEMPNAQVSASYELDLFGKNRAALDAALGQVRAAQADRQAAELLLATQVTRSYFTLLRLQALQDLAQRNLAQREHIVALVQARLKAGLDSPAELQSSEATLPEIRQYAEALREQATLARNALAALTGEPLGLQDLKPGTLARITALPTPRTMPMDLLANRPDVAAARARVQAGLSEVDVAKAQFYPNINLVAFAGLNSVGFGNISKAGSEQWGVGPAIRLPIFDGGRLRSQLKGKSADVDVAIETYNGLVVDAVREVADQLASLQSIARQSQEQQAAQANAKTLYDIAAQRFSAGLGNQALVLNAQTAVLAQERQAIELQARALDAQAQLLRATGGSVPTAAP